MRSELGWDSGIVESILIPDFSKIPSIFQTENLIKKLFTYCLILFLFTV